MTKQELKKTSFPKSSSEVKDDSFATIESKEMPDFTDLKGGLTLKWRNSRKWRGKQTWRGIF